MTHLADGKLTLRAARLQDSVSFAAYKVHQDGRSMEFGP